MARLIWGEASSRLYEYGLDRGVLYTPDENGSYVFSYPWNGLRNVEIGAEGRETRSLYQDGNKHDIVVTEGDLEGSLSAYTYPDEFSEFEGIDELGMGIFAWDQPRHRLFGLSYRTSVGSAEKGKRHGYKIHLVYNLIATPSNTSFETITDTTDPNEFSWDLTAIPVNYPGIRPTAHFVIDSTKAKPYLVKMLENELYGTDTLNPTLPSMARLQEILANGVKDVVTEPV